jgi:hypothetical protein
MRNNPLSVTLTYLSTYTQSPVPSILDGSAARCLGAFNLQATKKEARLSQLALLLFSLLLPLTRPVRLHTLGLGIARSGGFSAFALLCGRGSRRERSNERILRSRPRLLMGPGALQLRVEFVALCDEQRDDVFGRHK